MQEIERKILEVHKPKLIAQLRRLGARKIFAGLVRVKYFDTRDRMIKLRNDLFRVREFLERGKEPFSEVVYKTFKGIRQGCKFVEETEVKILGQESFSVLCKLFELLGFSQTAYYEKRRELYEISFSVLRAQSASPQLREREARNKGRPNEERAYQTKGSIFFEIDTYPKIPTFLEIEAPSPADIENAILRLGLQHHEQTAESISALIRRKYPHLNLKNLRFG